MPELLVLFACLNNTGCSETSSQYYAQHPEFQEFVKTEESRIKEAAGPIMTQYAAPVLYAISGRDATVRLIGNFYMTGNYEHQLLQFKKEF